MNALSCMHVEHIEKYRAVLRVIENLMASEDIIIYFLLRLRSVTLFQTQTVIQS